MGRCSAAQRVCGGDEEDRGWLLHRFKSLFAANVSGFKARRKRRYLDLKSVSTE